MGGITGLASLGALPGGLPRFSLFPLIKLNQTIST
jgi:hypothetical protein